MKTQEHRIQYVPYFDKDEQLFWPTISTKISKKSLLKLIDRGFVCNTLDECGNLCTKLNSKIFEVSVEILKPIVVES